MKHCVFEGPDRLRTAPCDARWLVQLKMWRPDDPDAITTGDGKPRIRSASSKPICTIRAAGAAPPRSTARSKPAENTPGRPVSNTTARSDSARSSALPSSASTAGESTFSLPSSIAIAAIESRSS